MRADRLISILMLLQARRKMTASELAGELEVSERTIYRDVQALSASGVPLYAEYGPGGGLALLGSYRTNLTGLKEDELRAIFLLFSAPGPLARLGVGQELKSALLKLSAALPGERRSEEERVRQRFYLDWSWWFHAQEPAPHLMTIQQAAWEDRRLRLRYRTFLGSQIDLDVDPYGLVAKAGLWYLVAGVEGAARVYRVSRLMGVEPLEIHFTRPETFNLADFWQDYCADYEKNQQAFQVMLRVSPQLMPMLPHYFGHRFAAIAGPAGAADAQGWITLTLSFESFEAARDRVLSFGGAVEVLEPEALRCSVYDFACQVANVYRQDEIVNRPIN